MNFFKKLFSSKKEDENQDQINPNVPNIKEIYCEDYFKKRYTETDIYKEPGIIDGCIKMVESYFLDNKIDEKIKTPINHPANLDQVVEEGIGFHTYCQSFRQEDSQIIFILAYAFVDYLIKEDDFKLYKDNEPEFPLRSMTLKYDKNGNVFSLYPFEYALKVLNNESRFEPLYDKIKDSLKNTPDIKEMLLNRIDKEKE